MSKSIEELTEDYMHTKTIQEIMKSALDNYLNERKAESNDQLFTIEDIRRVNQKMIDNHKANKNRGRILPIKKLNALTRGTVLKAVDNSGNSIIFDWDYIGCLDENLHYMKDYMHISGKPPVSFNEKEKHACTYDALSYLDIVDEETKKKFHDIVEWIKTNCSAEEKKTLEHKILSKEKIDELYGNVLYVQKQTTNDEYLVRYANVISDNICATQQYDIRNHTMTYSDEQFFVIEYKDASEVREANQFEMEGFCEQISVMVHCKENPFDKNKAKQYIPGTFMFLRMNMNDYRIFRWGYYDEKKNEIYSIGGIVAQDLEYTDGYLFEELENNRDYISNFKLDINDKDTIDELREATPLEINFFEMVHRRYYSVSDPYNAQEVHTTPTGQLFCGIRKDTGEYVKFVIKDSWFLPDDKDDNLVIIPELPFKVALPIPHWSKAVTIVRSDTKAFNYSDFEMIWYATKSEDYFFKEEYKKNGGRRDIEQLWSVKLPKTVSTSSTHKKTSAKSDEKATNDIDTLVQFYDEERQLKPFVTKVLVANKQTDRLVPAIFGCIIEKDIVDVGDTRKRYVMVGGNEYRYCFPYQQNRKHIGKVMIELNFK